MKRLFAIGVIFVLMITLPQIAKTTAADNMAGDSGELPGNKTFLNLSSGSVIRTGVNSHHTLYYSNNTIVFSEDTNTLPACLNGTEAFGLSNGLYLYFPYPMKITMVRVYPMGDFLSAPRKTDVFRIGRTTNYYYYEDHHRIYNDVFWFTETISSASVQEYGDYIEINFTNLVTPNICVVPISGSGFNEVEIYYDQHFNPYYYESNIGNNPTNITNVYRNMTYHNETYMNPVLDTINTVQDFKQYASCLTVAFQTGCCA